MKLDILSIIILIGFSYSQRISIFSMKTNEIINGCTVITNQKTYSLDSNFVDLDHERTNDHVSISHIAYQTKYFEFNRHDTIVYLKDKTIEESLVYVESKTNQAFKRLNISKNNILSNDLTHTLKEQTTLLISSYGGQGSLNEIKMNGLSGQHVAVMIEGFRINDNQNGIVNLSKLDLAHFNAVDIYNNGSNTNLTDNAIAGGINLISFSERINNVGLSYENGSYDSYRARINGDYAYLSTEIHFSLLKEYSTNYFPYWKNDTELSYRNHADYSKDVKSLKLSHLINQWISFDITYFHSYLDAGTPGSKRNLNTNFEKGELRQFDNLDLLILKSQINVSKDHIIEIGSQFQNDHQIYHSSSYYKNLKRSIRLTDFYSFKNSHRLESYIEYSMYELKGNTGSAPLIANLQKLSYGFVYSLLNIQNLNTKLSVRKDDHNFFENTLIYSLQLSYSLSDHWSSFISYSSQKRLPTFNELYWPSAGNPNLKPERSAMRSLGTKFNYNNLNIELKIFNHTYWNFIEWYANEFSELTVQNVPIYIHRGFTFDLNTTFSGLTFYLNYINQSFKNGNKLRFYSPDQTLNISNRSEFNGFESILTYRITDSYLIPNVEKHAPIRHQLNFATSYKIIINNFEFSPYLRFDNLLDIKSKPHIPYPEPNRNYTIGLNINFKIKDQNE